MPRRRWRTVELHLAHRRRGPGSRVRGQLGRVDRAAERDSGATTPADHPLECGADDVRADQPVRLSDILLEHALLDLDPEDIRDGLVERARLARVVEVGLVLSDAMSQFVPDDVDPSSRLRENAAVAV